MSIIKSITFTGPDPVRRRDGGRRNAAAVMTREGGGNRGKERGSVTRRGNAREKEGGGRRERRRIAEGGGKSYCIASYYRQFSADSKMKIWLYVSEILGYRQSSDVPSLLY